MTSRGEIIVKKLGAKQSLYILRASNKKRLKGKRVISFDRKDILAPKKGKNIF